MIFAYTHKPDAIRWEVEQENIQAIMDADWLDLICLTKEEEARVEAVLGIDIPTREEMKEIELSSRLYKKNGDLYMTASMIAKSTSMQPDLQPVTFILRPGQLITLRYVELQAFRLYIEQLKINSQAIDSPKDILIGILDASVDRLADILENVSYGLDICSQQIFPKVLSLESKKPDYTKIIQEIGLNADLNTKTRESLVNFNRLISFFAKSCEIQLPVLATIKKDIDALSDYATFISTKVNFLLDATLGMINIEQNAIIKIFSVAAVIFLPPTLIASIYGMNFKFMPELSFKYGYVVAIGLMILSAFLPYKYFKRKKWL